VKITATILCIILIVYLFRIDLKKSDGVSDAIWIPFIWILFALSRPISFWLNHWFGIGTASDFAIEDGNPIERAYLIILIGSGLYILSKRQLNWQKLFTENLWLCLFFIFAALSFTWSDYPFISFKRWIKSLGALIMVLVILSEKRPYEAIAFILRRIAFLLLPLSILFIKYYPDLGRMYHTTGSLVSTGVTDHKNALGALCMISGIYFAWELLLNHWQKFELIQRLHYSIYLIMIPLIIWLLYIANSATSLVCLLLAIFLFIVGRMYKFVQNPRSIFLVVFACIVIYGLLESTFDVGNFLIAMLGRRPDLTTRVPMWEELLTMAKNPITGFGFESFWLGERREIVFAHWGIDRQAHNGYLDMYLNLGYLGLFFVLAYTMSGLKKVYHYILTEYHNGLFRLCIILVFILYNWTENAFHLMCVLWLLLLFSIIDSPLKRELAGKN